jgi:ribonucleotide reductase beta subunit family protein with ferritin-like domain
MLNLLITLQKSIVESQERIKVILSDINENFYQFTRFLNEIDIEENINFFPESIQYIIEDVRKHSKNKIIFRDHSYPKNTCGLVKGKYCDFTEYADTVNVYITPNMIYE